MELEEEAAKIKMALHPDTFFEEDKNGNMMPVLGPDVDDKEGGGRGRRTKGQETKKDRLEVNIRKISSWSRSHKKDNDQVVEADLRYITDKKPLRGKPDEIFVKRYLKKSVPEGGSPS